MKRKQGSGAEDERAECRVPGCVAKGRTRGLCGLCYGRANQGRPELKDYMLPAKTTAKKGKKKQPSGHQSRRTPSSPIDDLPTLAEDPPLGSHLPKTPCPAAVGRTTADEVLAALCELATAVGLSHIEVADGMLFLQKGGVAVMYNTRLEKLIPMDIRPTGRDT